MFARLNVAFFKVAPKNVAPVAVAPEKSASVRFAPLKFARLTFAPAKFAPVRSWLLKSQFGTKGFPGLQLLAGGVAVVVVATVELVDTEFSEDAHPVSGARTSRHKMTFERNFIRRE
jgi:hypothetical protein